jgi:hypothetical protein
MIVESYEDVIILSGALRSNFWETIHTAISLTLRRHPTGVIIDCSGISECTPQGADTFRDAMEFIERHDARIIVAAVPAPVMEVLKSVAEVRSQLPIAASVEEARRSLDLLVDSGEPRRRRQTGTVRTLLAVLNGTESDAHVVALARELADIAPSEVCLLYPLLIPRELPLQSPLPEEEEKAAATLERGARAMGADAHYTKRLSRARDVAAAITEALSELDQVSQVIIGLPEQNGGTTDLEKFVTAILAKVKAPLMLVRAGKESDQ